MIDLRYSLVIEATEDPVVLGFTRQICLDSVVLVTPWKIVSTKPSGRWKSTFQCCGRKVFRSRLRILTPPCWFRTIRVP